MIGHPSFSVALLLGALTSAACSGKTADNGLPAASSAEVSGTAPARAAPAQSEPTPAPPDAALILGESEARAVLSAMFRTNGFRVVYDVRVTTANVEVTLDGFDPARKVGFEYIDTSERGVDLSAEEKDALGRTDNRILIVTATDRANLERQARAFLVSVNKP